MSPHRNDSELLRRLDDHIARMDEVLLRQEGAIERNTRAFERSERAFKRSEQAFEKSDQRFELNRLAFERTFAGIDAMVKVLEDMRQDIRANTQAVLKLLDRFDNGGQTA